MNITYPTDIVEEGMAPTPTPEQITAFAEEIGARDSKAGRYVFTPATYYQDLARDLFASGAVVPVTGA